MADTVTGRPEGHRSQDPGPQASRRQRAPSHAHRLRHPRAPASPTPPGSTSSWWATRWPTPCSGYADTLQVDVAVMAHHVAAVGRATTRALVVGDMPWLSYHVSVEDTVRNAATLVRAGAEAVKLEGGRARVARDRGAPGRRDPGDGPPGAHPAVGPRHGGLQGPGQGAGRGGRRPVNDAKAIGRAGCFAIVLEGVPDVVAARVTAEVDVPTIGIGAGAGVRRPGPRVPRPAGPARGGPPSSSASYADLTRRP